ncbi:MAG: hypothetical protein PHD04_00730 [Candidatus Pacebacteria bacterium]|nr:hypothetical protein [Candidatus Paceibacterota bacterium]
MKVQKILDTRITDLGLRRATTTCFLRNWRGYPPRDCSEFEREEWRSKQNEREKDLTVGKLIAEWGDFPTLMSDGSFGSASHVFRKFAERLIALGLTPKHWPPLALSMDGAFEAIINRAGGNKEKLKCCPAIALGMSLPAMTGVRRILSRPREEKFEGQVPWEQITIRDLLTLSPFDIMVNSPARDCRQSLVKTREKLRALEFGNGDGPFLSEGNRDTVVNKVSADLQLPKQHTQKVLEYFGWGSFRILD